MRSTMALFALALAVSAPAASANEPSDYAAALADAQRPAADKERDAARHPAEFLAFAQIDPGEKVGDYIMGGGYWTRLLATAVGPQGKVYAFQPDEFIAFRAAYGDEQNAAVAGRANVAALRGPVSAPPFPEKLDTIITVQNLHDLYLGAFPADTATKSIAALFDALKPGGTLVVVDHSAADGSGTTAAGSIHRIDKAAAIAALTNAGFVVEAQSDLYKQPNDPRTANVFDPSIRGKTDQFALRLRKPN
ncbi:MAG: class I SAM-dependent methyltransferase [Porphyrobacter sp.]|nr:class I SAM-dependent methyltransferase [Porphyrobacter sp.]